MKQYLKHFSATISQEIQEYVIEEPLKFSRYIFTHREGKQQKGYCTHCKTEFKTNGGLKHKQKTTCPKCNSQCKVQSSGLGRKYMKDGAIIEYYEKSLIDPNVMVARVIHVSKDYSQDYKKTKIKYDVLALYVFKMNESKMYKSYWKNDFEETGSVYTFCEGYYSGLAYSCSFDSIEKAIKDTPFKYSMWSEYKDYSMVKFFDVYSKYPCIEYLTKEGFRKLVETKIYGMKTYRAINWKANFIYKILRLNKAELKELKTSMFYDNALFLRLFQMSKKDKSKISIQEIEENLYTIGGHYTDLLSIHKHANLRKIFNYTEKQYTRYKKHFYSKAQVLITWKDYLKDCEILEMDIKSDSVFFPKNLHNAHQNTITQVKVQANEYLNKRINNRAKALSKYIFEYKNLLIRPIKDSEELINEGKELHHCVGTYAESYAKGTTNIFAIREKSSLDKPYFTLELKNNTIIQIRGNRNCNPTKDVNDFIEVFKTQKLEKKKQTKERILA